MKKNSIIIATCIALVIVGVNVFSETETVYVKQVKSEADVVAERIEAIYNSEEFESEMRALAEARALYEISNETQENAVALSERAMQSFQKNKAMNEAWYSNQETK